MIKKLIKKYIFLTILILVSNTYLQANNINRQLFNTLEDTDFAQGIIVDYSTGDILYGKNIHQKFYPASLTKLMTIYLLFNKLKFNEVKIDDQVIVSRYAYKYGHYSNGSSTMFLKHKEQVSLEQLIYGVVVISGNDASMAVAEYLYGSENEFIQAMNQMAMMLGMHDSHFANVDGRYSEQNYSSVYDMSLLIKHIIRDFPEYYAKYFSTLQYTHHDITQYNRNKLLFANFNNNITVDGVKTGHIDESGYSLAFSALRNDWRIIGVFSGSNSSRKRTLIGKKMIYWTYNNYHKYTFFHEGDLLQHTHIYNTNHIKFPIVANEDIEIVVPKKIKYEDLSLEIVYRNYYSAPLHKGENIAKIFIKINNNMLKTYNVVNIQNIQEDKWRFLYYPYDIVIKLFDDYISTLSNTR